MLVRHAKEQYKIQKKTTMDAREELAQHFAKLAHISEMKAKNKFGLLNRLQIKPELFNQIEKTYQPNLINKNLLNECAPIEVRKIVAESDVAFSKLIELNN